MTGKYFVWISVSRSFHSFGCWSAGSVSVVLILASIEGSEKASKLVPSPTFAMSVDWKFGGIQVEPEGQSEHQPTERKLMSVFGSARTSVYCASVVATGVALKPAASSAFTVTSFDLVLTGLSVRHRNLIS